MSVRGAQILGGRIFRPTGSFFSGRANGERQLKTGGAKIPGQKGQKNLAILLKISALGSIIAAVFAIGTALALSYVNYA
jgi:hypothetical protein